MKTNNYRSLYAKNTELKKSVDSVNTRHVLNSGSDLSYKIKIVQTNPVKLNSLPERKIEQKEEKSDKTQAEPGLVQCRFKIKSKNEINSIVAMPLGSKGHKTSWNLDGLSTKELLKQRYDEGAKNPRSAIFGYFYTPYAPLSLEDIRLKREVFKVSRGFDIAVSITNRNGDGTISAGRFLPYTTLALKLDTIANRMVQTVFKNDANYKIEHARNRINGDIIRTGSGTQIKGQYSQEEWHNLAEFAMVIRADKARAPQSTRYYIDKAIRDYSKSFKERFGNGAASSYEGAPKGGAKKIKDRQILYVNFVDADLTDTRSETFSGR